MAERIFGQIPGIFEQQAFANRLELAAAKVHKPIQAGISGSQHEGADSIVLSGGYEDDKDYGDIIVYTGHGGRDINTGKQVVDQVLSNQNLALAKNCQLGLPVRVIRGFAHKSDFAPMSGYRYDGLYYVESYWKERGKSGHIVWRYKLVKEIPDSSERTVVEEKGVEFGNEKPVRKEVTIQRIVRDTAVGRAVKKIHEYKCQVCNWRVETTAGYYAEAAHTQPLGSPHNGPDILSNLLCLCPNHHVMFDFGGFAIDDGLSLLGLEGKLIVNPAHRIDLDFIRYHRRHFWE